MIPEQLKKEEFRFVLLKPRDKVPFEPNWQKRGYTYYDPKLIHHIKNGGNYGVIGGYGNLRILDIDDTKYVKEFDLDTFIVETGGGGRHIYVLSDYDSNHVLTNGIGEFRAKFYQVVGAGCIHPNGREYKVVKDRPIRFVDKLTLKSMLLQYIRTDDYSDQTNDTKKTDTTRSGKEFGVVCNFIRQGLSKEKIFDEMKLYSKWAGATPQYREMTYNKALEKIKKETKKKEKNIIYTSTYIDKKQAFMAEEVFDGEKPQFCVYNLKTKEITYQDEIEDGKTKIRPLFGEEIYKGAIKLPIKAEEYGTDKELDEEIKAFINKWLDVPQNMVLFGLWNIKRSWVYERFHTLNYLRALGDTGVGKSRFLDTLGYLHYKPITTSGATTAAPIFRIIDKWKGTLIMDEADFHRSDESQDIIKIINQGYEKNKYVMRCDKENKNKVNFFDPFCPKILATRRSFFDKATESRCITYVMKETHRKDIPLNLNQTFWDALSILRNKLLMWKFRNYYKINPEKTIDFDFGDLEPRVKQIVYSFVNLFSEDKEQLDDFKEFITRHQDEIIEERRNSFEGSVVGAIFSLLKKGEFNISSSDIITEGGLTNLKGQPLQPRALSSILKGLGFTLPISKKVEGQTKRCLPLEPVRVQNLLKRYGYGVTEVTLNTIQENLIYKYIEPTGEQKSRGIRNARNLRNSVTFATEKKDEFVVEEEKIEDD